jgi:hypothetical protein
MTTTTVMAATSSRLEFLCRLDAKGDETPADYLSRRGRPIRTSTPGE